MNLNIFNCTDFLMKNSRSIPLIFILPTFLLLPFSGWAKEKVPEELMQKALFFQIVYRDFDILLKDENIDQNEEFHLVLSANCGGLDSKARYSCYILSTLIYKLKLNHDNYEIHEGANQLLQDIHRINKELYGKKYVEAADPKKFPIQASSQSSRAESPFELVSQDIFNKIADFSKERSVGQIASASRQLYVNSLSYLSQKPLFTIEFKPWGLEDILKNAELFSHFRITGYSGFKTFGRKHSQAVHSRADAETSLKQITEKLPPVRTLELDIPLISGDSKNYYNGGVDLIAQLMNQTQPQSLILYISTLPLSKDNSKFYGALESLSHMRNLAIKSSLVFQFPDEVFTQILASMQKLTDLNYLNLDDNVTGYYYSETDPMLRAPVRHLRLIQFANTVLTHHPSIKKVSLKQNAIGLFPNEVLDALATAISKNPVLEVIDLRANVISKSAQEHFEKIVSKGNSQVKLIF